MSKREERHEDAEENTYETLVEKVKMVWGGRTVVTPEGLVQIPPVREKGATDQVIRLAIKVAMDELW